MIGDLIVFLSGWIPFGIVLLFIVGAVFTLIWAIVWGGTKFWSRDLFWRLLWRGWLVIALLYTVAWSFNRTPPIPIRVVIHTADNLKSDAGNWQIAGVADAIESRIRHSKRPLTLLTGEVCPVIDRSPAAELETAASRLKVKWLIRVDREPEGGENSLRIQIAKCSGGGFSVKKTISGDATPLYLKADQYAEAVAHYIGDSQQGKDVFRFQPGSGDDALETYYRTVGIRDTASRDLKKAVFDSLRIQYPQWASVHRKYARCLYEENPVENGSEIHSVLLEALKSNPTDTESLLLLGRFFEESGEWEEAASALKLAWASDPDDPRVHFYLSRLKNGRLHDMPVKSKLRLMKWALHLAPGYETARLALSQWRTGKLERPKALSDIEDGLRIEPRSIPLMLTKSALLVQLGYHEKAISAARDILNIDPAHAGALYNCGIALVWLERYDEARVYFESSWANGGTVDNLFYMGVICQRKNEYEEAIKYYQHRLRLAKSEDDRVAISAQERIKLLKRKMAEGELPKSAGGEVLNED